MGRSAHRAHNRHESDEAPSPTMTRPAHLNRLLLLPASALLLSACQSLAPESAPADGDFHTAMVALYASPSEATAVALGQFGAVPVLLAPETELQPAEDCPGARAQQQRCSCMRSLRTGQRGWLPAAPGAEPAPAHLLQALWTAPR